MAGENRKLPLERSFFMMAFGRDADYQDTIPQRAYLDRKTGDMTWVYEDDDEGYMYTGIPAAENREARERMAAEPGRYLDIPGLDHGDHHRILKQFLWTDRCDDEQRKDNAAEAYFGSIGGWKKSVDDQGAIHAFYDYQEAEIKKLAEAFLRENNIVPDWN